MTYELFLVAAVSIIAVAGTIVLVARDGYHRIPTRWQ
jgi:hypothetical protein